MRIHNYVTSGGKDLILDYISKLSKKEQEKIYKAIAKILDDGVRALEILNTRQLDGKLWEIKVDQNRVMYVLKDKENIYFLHICKKQKGKAEKFELDKAIKRAKELYLM